VNTLAFKEVLPVLCNGIIIDWFWLGDTVFNSPDKTGAYYCQLFFKELRKLGYKIVTFAPANSSIIKEVRAQNGECIWLNKWRGKKTASYILSTWPNSLKYITQGIKLLVEALWFCPKCNLVFPAKSCHPDHELIKFVPLKNFSYTLSFGLAMKLSDESKSITWFLKALQEGKLKVENTNQKELIARIAISALK
jgi:hypothetical protein